MAYSTLRVDYSCDIATMTLNRPERRNALTGEMIGEVIAGIAEVEAGRARMLIITGAGDAFCSGMDIEELKLTAGQSI